MIKGQKAKSNNVKMTLGYSLHLSYNEQRNKESTAIQTKLNVFSNLGKVVSAILAYKQYFLKLNFWFQYK